MTFELKTLTPDAVPRAIAKAERYRLLNEPGEAESICRDALQADPGNQDAVVMLLLSVTDQFDDDAAMAVVEAWKCAGELRNEYDRAYYSGIIWERRAKARRSDGPTPRTTSGGGRSTNRDSRATRRKRDPRRSLAHWRYRPLRPCQYSQVAAECRRLRAAPVRSGFRGCRRPIRRRPR